MFTNKFIEIFSNNNFYKIMATLWILGIVTTIGVLIMILLSEERVLLLSAFAILLSAFMASASMTKTIILNTNKEEREERIILYKERLLVKEEAYKFISSTANGTLTLTEELVYRKFEKVLSDSMHIFKEDVFKYLNSVIELSHQRDENFKKMLKLINKIKRMKGFVDNSLSMPTIELVISTKDSEKINNLKKDYNLLLNKLEEIDIQRTNMLLNLKFIFAPYLKISIDD